MDDKGFIILRHVNNDITNNYWIHCYNCIRKFYENDLIVIIDDNSDYNFITTHTLKNTIIINSEYKGRGELLPYIYYLRYNFFNKAIIIHDSVFINSYIDFSIDNYKFLWEFKNHKWD